MRENFTHGTHAKRLEADIRNSRVLSRPRIASAASRRDVALVRVVIRPLRHAIAVAIRLFGLSTYKSPNKWRAGCRVLAW